MLLVKSNPLKGGANQQMKELEIGEIGAITNSCLFKINVLFSLIIHYYVFFRKATLKANKTISRSKFHFLLKGSRNIYP